MASILILSSFVAANRVGGGAQALALARLGVDPVLAPTVLYGRHPGRGAPGGSAVDGAALQSLLDAIAWEGRFATFDAVITGYFARADQAAVAIRTLDMIRAANPRTRIFVDPIMGEAGRGLYVDAHVAELISEEIAPRADLILPNAWELARLAGHPVFDAATATQAARAFGKPAVVTSIEAGGEIGALLVTGERSTLALHAKVASAPKGTGDLFTALFAGAAVLGWSDADALAFAAGSVSDAVARARANRADDLLVTPDRLDRTAAARLVSV